tara:strand:+ start:275 stop:523 length:249 start_codon:yes stop_codon:yes gene_type:complete
MLTQVSDSKVVLIHCNPSALDDIKELGLEWNYSQQFGKNEIDVYVKDVEFDSLTDDPDELLCDYYNINYDQVNCIEAYNYVA